MDKQKTRFRVSITLTIKHLSLFNTTSRWL